MQTPNIVLWFVDPTQNNLVFLRKWQTIRQWKSHNQVQYYWNTLTIFSMNNVLTENTLPFVVSEKMNESSGYIIIKRKKLQIM
jgi:hypothetical protein